MTSPSTRVVSGDGSYRIFETIAYNEAEAAMSISAAGELITHEIAGDWVGI